MERGSGFSSHGKNAKCTAGLSLAAGSSGMRMLHTNDDFPSNHPTYAPSATTYANINAVQNTTRSANPNDSSSNGTKNGEGRRQCAALREQDQYMPIANVIRIMRRVLPPHAKISDEAKETVQECVSEYISFITGEANDRCQREQRRTISAEDVLWAMAKLGFDDYLAPLSLFLSRYRQNDNERCSSVHDLLSSLKRSANAAAADCVCVPAAVTLPPMIQAASFPMGDRQFHLGIDAAAAAAAASAMPGGFHTPAPRPPSPPPPPPPPGDASQHGFTSYDPYTQYKGQ